MGDMGDEIAGSILKGCLAYLIGIGIVIGLIYYIFF